MREVFGCDAQLAEDRDHTFADWWVLAQVLSALAAHLRQAAQQRCIVALSGAQGSGKSTLAAVLCDYMRSQGIQADTVSLDDFYLTHAQRQQLAAQVHPLLATRGVPGTHDWAWLAKTLQQMKRGGELHLPVFDKGLDDRAGSRHCTPEVLILEGWCLGVQQQARAELVAPLNQLEKDEDGDGVWRRWVNEQILLHYEPLWQFVDLWAVLRAPDFTQIQQWRWLQEQQLPPEQRMSRTQLQRFIDHYERLTRWQWRCKPRAPGVLAELDADHRVGDVTLLTT